MQLYLTLCILLLALVGCSSALPCSSCDHIMTSSGTYAVVDNSQLGLAPGSIICWNAANTHNSGFIVQNFTGTASSRYTFTNCGGTAVIDTSSHAFVCNRCKYVRVTGKYDTNSTTTYGLRITRSSFGVAFQTGSTFVELDHVEISGTLNSHAAVVAKTDPTVENGAFTRPGFVMEDVWLHHNYIHDTSSEAFYVGYKGFEEGNNAHEIHGLRLYANIVKNTGWDGIQVGCAMQDTKVFNNYVTNFGTLNEQYQNAGIILLTGFKGEVYGNKVNSGTGIGILYHGNLDTSIYNNVVIDAALGAISASVEPPRTDPGTFTAWHHNTISGYGGNGLNIYITIPGNTAYAFNNVIIGTGTCSNLGGGLDDSNLCATAITSDMKFTDPANADYSLLANSSLIDKGIVCTPNAITTDWNGGARNAPPDLGAFEYGTAPRNDDEGLAGDGSSGDGNSGDGASGSAATLVPLLTFLVSLTIMIVLLL